MRKKEIPLYIKLTVLYNLLDGAWIALITLTFNEFVLRERTMKAVVFRGVGDIALQEVREPVLVDHSDAIIRLTTTTICGTDLHMVRGSISGMVKGTILGHEGVGIVEQIGKEVKKFKVGDRVIIPSTIACGHCIYCIKQLYSQCNNANPNGPLAGTAFYGGPKSSGPFQGLQAEKARVPFADISLIKIPDTVRDEQVILLSDILPTAYQAVESAEPQPDDTVAVFGCGPVGQLVIACLKKQGVKNTFAIDSVPSRLAMAQAQGAHVINFNEANPVEVLRQLTSNSGPDKIIDAVGIDSEQPHTCVSTSLSTRYQDELKEIAPITNPHGDNWHPGNAPSLVLEWAVAAVAKAGIVSIIGVYPDSMRFFPIGSAMGKNLTVRAGNCNHRKYIPKLLDWVKEGTFDTTPVITQKLPFKDALTAYEHFDKRDESWIKVMLKLE